MVGYSRRTVGVRYWHFKMWAANISAGRKMDNFLKLKKTNPCVPTIVLLEKSIKWPWSTLGWMWKMVLCLHYKYLITQNLLTICWQKGPYYGSLVLNCNSSFKMSCWLFWGKINYFETLPFDWYCHLGNACVQLNARSSLEQCMYEAWMLDTCSSSLRTICHWEPIVNLSKIHGRAQEMWLGSAKLFWCVNVVNKLHGAVAKHGFGKECVPVWFLGVSPGYFSGGCEFFISDAVGWAWGLALGLQVSQLAGARQFTTPLLASYACFGIFFWKRECPWHCLISSKVSLI